MGTNQSAKTSELAARKSTALELPAEAHARPPQKIKRQNTTIDVLLNPNSFDK